MTRAASGGTDGTEGAERTERTERTEGAERTGSTGGTGSTDGPPAPPGVGRSGRAHAGNRYGRSERGRLAILEAADDLVVEKGFDAVTMEGIAARAGVAKQTIYRWWKSKADVLMEAFLQDAAEDLEPPDSGDLAADLREYLGRLAQFLSRSEAGVVFRALIARAQLDPEFADEFRARCLEPQRRRDMLPLQRAVARGRLPAGLDVAVETERLVSPLYYRVLVSGEPLEADVAEALAQSFLLRHGLG